MRPGKGWWLYTDDYSRGLQPEIRLLF
jgi:hypothetical protein